MRPAWPWWGMWWPSTSPLPLPALVALVRLAVLRMRSSDMRLSRLTEGHTRDTFASSLCSLLSVLKGSCKQVEGKGMRTGPIKGGKVGGTQMMHVCTPQHDAEVCCCCMRMRPHRHTACQCVSISTKTTATVGHKAHLGGILTLSLLRMGFSVYDLATKAYTTRPTARMPALSQK